MSDDSSDRTVEEYQTELGNTVGDGGGCCETWNALSDLREQMKNRDQSRRRFLRGIGGAAAGAALLGAIDPVTAAETGPFATLTRTQLTDDDADETIQTALDSSVTQAVVQELPKGSDDLVIAEATAYRIVDESGEAAPLTQVLIPVAEQDVTLGYSSNGTSSAAGVRLAEGRFAQAIEGPKHDTNGVEHKRIAQDEEKRKVLNLVRENEEYRQWVQELNPDYRVREDQAQVSIIEEEGIGYVYVPVTAKQGVHPDDASDKAILATVNLNTWEVIEVRDGYWDCMAVCAATSPTFWGICWSCCCQWCWADPTRATCVVCFGCIGFTLAYCTGQCI